MQDKFNQFYEKHKGKPVEVNDSSNLYQCMDLAYAWCDYLQIPRDTIRHLYAFQVYTNPHDITLDYFHIIPNTPNGKPHAGDLVVFSKSINGKAGHIAIATGKGDINTFESFDQNFKETIKKAGLITHSYDFVLGWLRPKNVKETSVFTDQTIIPLGTDLGNWELQAIRSEIVDLRRIRKTLELERDRLRNASQDSPNQPGTAPEPKVVYPPIHTYFAYLFDQLVAKLTRK